MTSVCKTMGVGSIPAARTSQMELLYEAIPRRKEKEMALYTVTAFDADGNVIAVSDGEMTFENADCARDFMRREFRPARVLISDSLGYTY